MATRLIQGTFREVWLEVVPLAGGSSTPITTNIRLGPDQLSRVKGMLVVTTVSGAPGFTAVPGISAGGFLTVLVSNNGGLGDTGTWQLDVKLVHSFQQATRPGAGIIFVVAGGASTGNTAEVANWPLTDVRHFLVDPVNGDDANVGYVDAPLAATSIVTTGKAVKTIARYLSIIPRVGNGRLAISHFANNSQASGSSYAASLSYRGFGGYSYFLKRAWTAWLDQALYPCWSPTDRDIEGAKIAIAGPNPDSSWTVNTIDPAIVLKMTVVAGGAALASDAATLYRVRFSGNVTPAVTNMRAGIYKSDTGAIELIRDPANSLAVTAIPAAGDTFWIETQGVSFTSFREAEGTMATNITSGLDVSGSASNSLVIGASSHCPLYCFLGQSYDGTSSLVSMTEPYGSSLTFQFLYPLPAGSFNATNGPTRFAAQISLARLNRIEWDSDFGSVKAPGSEVNHGKASVGALFCIAGGGVFLGGLTTFNGGEQIGTNSLSQSYQRMLRVVRVLALEPGVSGTTESQIKVSGVWFDDAVFKLGDAIPPLVGVNLRAHSLTGGPTVNATDGSTGKKTGFYCRNTVHWKIVLGIDNGTLVPTITGADGDILLYGDGWVHTLSYADLAKSDFTDLTNSKWNIGNTFSTIGNPRAGSKLTNADVIIAPGTDKCSFYELPYGVLSANHQATVQVTDMLASQVVCIRIRDVSANTYAIINGGPGAGTLFTKPASPGAVIDVWIKFDGTNIVLDRTIYKDA